MDATIHDDDSRTDTCDGSGNRLTLIRADFQGEQQLEWNVDLDMIDFLHLSILSNHQAKLLPLLTREDSVPENIRIEFICGIVCSTHQ